VSAPAANVESWPVSQAAASTSSPPVIDGHDRAWLVSAFDEVIAECHQVPGAIWRLGTSLAHDALAHR
jgi:hypothetical protein